MAYNKEIEKLTINMVKIPSINGTIGEAKIADFIYDWLKKIDYFKRYPELVWTVSLKNDRLGRKNVFALIKGKKGDGKNTVILHGHTDTVGVEDYGTLKEWAFDPIVLQEKLSKIAIPQEVKNDLVSGDYLFGRGSNDMKSGLAVHMFMIKQLTEEVEDLNGNVLFMANPVEENQHTGIVEALDVLEDLKIKENLNYLVAINNDYISPLYPGDPYKYIYLGSVGKLLPCFLIRGKETHVGQCFEGLDPTIIASFLNMEIDLNVELCDEVEGEVTLPPTCLKQKDSKIHYNVQTPNSSEIYYNYFTHDMSTKEVVDLLVKKAEKAFEKAIEHYKSQFKEYCRMSGIKYHDLLWKPQVITYEQLYTSVKEEQGSKIDRELEKLSQELLDDGNDLRDISYKIVSRLLDLYPKKDPVIILFFAPPYCPHNYVRGKNNNEQALLKKLDILKMKIESTEGEKIQMKKFFPCLSDSSYLMMDDDDESIDALINNFPQWHKIYPIPVHKIRKMNVPAINFGAYGKDAHTFTERVYKPYSFGVLPRMIQNTIRLMLSD